MKKSKYWFVKIRGSYLPSSWQGWLSYVPFVAYLLSTIYVTDRLNKHANIYVVVLYGLIPEWIAAGLLMTWFAKSKSRKAKR